MMDAVQKAAEALHNDRQVMAGACFGVPSEAMGEFVTHTARAVLDAVGYEALRAERDAADADAEAWRKVAWGYREALEQIASKTDLQLSGSTPRLMRDRARAALYAEREA